MTAATFDDVFACIEAQRKDFQAELEKEREEAELRLEAELKKERKERKEAFDQLSRECQSLREGLHLRAPPVRAGDDALSIPARTDEEEAEVQHVPERWF